MSCYDKPEPYLFGKLPRCPYCKYENEESLNKIGKEKTEIKCTNCDSKFYAREKVEIIYMTHKYSYQ